MNHTYRTGGGVTALLAFVALLTLADLGFAAVVAARIIRERRIWREVRQRRRQSVVVGPQAAEEVSDVAACLQVWLDQRWHQRFG